MQAGNEDASKGRLAVFGGVRCFERRRRHQGGGGGLASLWRGLGGRLSLERSCGRSENVVVGREMQDAKMETKDYSAKKTKGEQSVPRARCEASAVDLFPLSPTPAHCAKLNSSQDCGVVGNRAICCRRNDDTSRRLPHDAPKALCAVQSTPYLTRTASRGVTWPMAFTESLLTHARRMDAE